MDLAVGQARVVVDDADPLDLARREAVLAIGTNPGDETEAILSILRPDPTRSGETLPKLGIFLANIAAFLRNRL
jgi:hypothetical protein